MEYESFLYPRTLKIQLKKSLDVKKNQIWTSKRKIWGKIEENLPKLGFFARFEAVWDIFNIPEHFVGFFQSSSLPTIIFS